MGWKCIQDITPNKSESAPIPIKQPGNGSYPKLRTQEIIITS